MTPVAHLSSSSDGEKNTLKLKIPAVLWEWWVNFRTNSSLSLSLSLKFHESSNVLLETPQNMCRIWICAGTLNIYNILSQTP